MFYEEQARLNKDTRAKMYGRVVDKKARYNLCFGFTSQQANYGEGKGTIVSFESVPLLNEVRLQISRLVAEGNYYYDITKCGIGYHGDTERRKVIGIRVGASLPLCYQWYHRHKPIGSRCNINLNHGDVYIMSDKAVGHDWKFSSKITLRHAAGCNKFIA
jgi:alkylated DNA repair dioxygenase AlkB